MEYEKAISILKTLLDKHQLDAEEREAVTVAIGLLSIGVMAKSKIKAQNAKRSARREQSAQW